MFRCSRCTWKSVFYSCSNFIVKWHFTRHGIYTYTSSFKYILYLSCFIWNFAGIYDWWFVEFSRLQPQPQTQFTGHISTVSFVFSIYNVHHIILNIIISWKLIMNCLNKIRNFMKIHRKLVNNNFMLKNINLNDWDVGQYIKKNTSLFNFKRF